MSRSKKLHRFGGGRSVHEQDLADEMAWHIECLVNELVQAGRTPEEAQAEAARRFGSANAYRRACRSIDARQRSRRRRQVAIAGTRTDLLAASRSLRSQPLYAATVVLTLALAIGLGTTIFSVVDAVMLTPLPLPDPDRVLNIQEVERESGETNTVTPANFTDWRTQSESFSSMAAIERRQPTLGDPEAPTRLRAAAVTEDFFHVAGAAMALGRPFDRDEHQRVDARVAILSHTLFQGRFRADPTVVGSTIELDGEATHVVGVMPAGFDLPLATDLWVPLVFDFDVAGARGAHYLRTLGRLAEGVDRSAAFAELDGIARRLEAAYPNTNTNSGIALTPLMEAQTTSVRPILLALVAAVAIVLLIACTNIAGLTLARAVGREREMALRTALGARRTQLARQLLGEALLLAIAGGSGGLLLAWLAVERITRQLPFDIPRIDQVGINGGVLLFTWLITLACTLFFALAPTLRLTRVPVERTLREQATSTLGIGRRLRLRQGLVAVELALALVLLMGCGLLVRSLSALSNVDLGFDTSDTLTFELDLPASRYSEDQSIVFYERLLEALAALPGVRSAAMAPWLPLTPGWMFSFQIVGEAPAPPEARQGANLRMIAGDYFATLGIPRVAGRSFDLRDDAASQPVIVVNQALADHYFAGRDPLGQELELGYGQADGPKIRRRIVGVVGNVHHFGPAGPALPTVYAPHGQIPFESMAVALRVDGDPLQLAPAVRGVIRELDAGLAVNQLETLAQRYADLLALRRFVPLLLGAFAATALLLAAVGLYGVLAQLVAARTPELGIRRALGASGASIVWLVLRRALILVGLGVGGGLVGSWASARVLQRLLFGVEPGDPVTLLAVGALLATVAMVTCIVPAVRANRIDPVRTLRQL